MNKLYKHIVNFLVIVPFPNALLGLETNALTLAHLAFMIIFMVLLLGMNFISMKIKTGTFVVYLLVFAVILLNLTNIFAGTFLVRILFAITAGWFLCLWNYTTEEQELMRVLKTIMYVIGFASLLIYVVKPPPDPRLAGLYDVHTTKYFFFAFVVILCHQVVMYSRTRDYVALGFAFFILLLSLQRGILATTIVFLVLTFRENLFKRFTWIVLILIISFFAGLFDPLIDRLFYTIPTSGNWQDYLANINTSGRLEFWKYLIEEENVTFFGNGLGYSIEIGKSKFAGLNLVHNDFLWILYDLGIFGLASLFYILYHIYRRITLQGDKVLRTVFHSLIVSLPIVMFLDNFILHLYIYFPLLFAYFTLQSRRNAL